jgi:hypothetical protein
MIITINCQLTFQGSNLVIRHKGPEGASALDNPVFGIPAGRDLRPEEAEDLLRNLPLWVLDRFRLEMDAAIRQAQQTLTAKDGTA